MMQKALRRGGAWRNAVTAAFSAFALLLLLLGVGRAEAFGAAPFVKALSIPNEFPNKFQASHGARYPDRHMKMSGQEIEVTCYPNEYASKGGVLLRSQMMSRGATNIKLAFDVRFGTNGQKNFDFKKGGKAGLGVQFGAGHIQGGNWLPTAASARVMWRANGVPHAYVYYGKRSSPMDMSDQNAGYASIATPSGETSGHDVWRKPQKFANFKSGIWQTVILYCKMNTPGQRNGVIEMSVNGEMQRYDQMRWLDTPQGVDSVEFCVWYGGGDSTWAPNTVQRIYFKNLKISGW